MGAYPIGLLPKQEGGHRVHRRRKLFRFLWRTNTKENDMRYCEFCHREVDMGEGWGFCISCQKEMEGGHGWDMQSNNSNAGWAKISDRALGLVDSMESVNLADYES
jgi:hypothetical protein